MLFSLVVTTSKLCVFLKENNLKISIENVYSICNTVLVVRRGLVYLHNAWSGQALYEIAVLFFRIPVTSSFRESSL